MTFPLVAGLGEVLVEGVGLAPAEEALVMAAVAEQVLSKNRGVETPRAVKDNSFLGEASFGTLDGRGGAACVIRLWTNLLVRPERRLIL